MYRVYFCINGNAAVAAKEFPSLKEATEFANNQPINSVVIIKYYDDKTPYTQD